MPEPPYRPKRSRPNLVITLWIAWIVLTCVTVAVVTNAIHGKVHILIAYVVVIADAVLVVCAVVVTILWWSRTNLANDADATLRRMAVQHAEVMERIDDRYAELAEKIGAAPSRRSVGAEHAEIISHVQAIRFELRDRLDGLHAEMHKQRETMTMLFGEMERVRRDALTAATSGLAALDASQRRIDELEQLAVENGERIATLTKRIDELDELVEKMGKAVYWIGYGGGVQDVAGGSAPVVPINGHGRH